ncbi:MAG TPA: MMPL family transporter, partial [Pirellulaceae bacterium]
MMALGSMVVLLSCGLVIPALTLLGPKDRVTGDHAGERFLNRRLLELVSLVERYPRRLAIFTILGSLLASAGAYFLESETDFTRNFRRGTEIVSSYELVEAKLGGAGVLDIMIEAPEILSWPYLQRVLVMESQLRADVHVAGQDGGQQHGLTKILSLADAVYYAAARDISRARRLQQVLIKTGLNMMRRAIPEFYDALYSARPDAEGKRHFRIMLRARERQPSSQKREIIERVTAIARHDFPEAEVTGYFVLLTNLIDSVLRDQWRTFGIAVAGIFVVMVVAVRSVKLALIALIPNVVPIVVVNGLMGWLGFRMNMGAAMIAAVSMGLAIDGAIHYLIALRRARNEGRGLSEAVAVVQQSVGRGMTFSVLALVIGFSALATSPFVPTVYF